MKMYARMVADSLRLKAVLVTRAYDSELLSPLESTNSDRGWRVLSS